MTIHRCREHYSGVRILTETTYSQVKTVTSSLRAPPKQEASSSPFVSYSAKQLTALKTPNLSISRRVRKRLFALQLWKPGTSKPESLSVWDTKQIPVHPQRMTKSAVKFLHWPTPWRIPCLLNANVRSLADKIDDLQAMCDFHHIDTAVRTETWLTDNSNDGLTSLNRYSAVFNNRASRGGGVACYIRNDIPFTRWSNLEEEGLETLWITARPPQLPRNIPMITLGVIYHPPRANEKK